MESVNGIQVRPPFTKKKIMNKNEVIISGKESIWWRDVLLVSKNVSCKLENGENTQFWKDRWIGNKLFMEEFPFLYFAGTTKERNIMETGSWCDGRWY